jgi:O-antigen/teichoic acid export membrane protein
VRLAERPAVRRALWTFGTQGLSSASNFVLTVLVLTTASARTFALYSVCITTYLLILQFGRYVIGVPVLIVYSRSSESGESADAASSRPGPDAAVGLAAVAGVAATCVLVLVAVAWREVGPLFLVLAVAMPWLLAQDALRHVAISRRQPEVAARGDGTWLGLQLVASALVLAVGGRSATVLVAVWAAAGVAAAALLAARLRATPDFRRVGAWLGANAVLCRRVAGEFFTNSGSFYVLAYGLAALAGAEELGYLRAAQTLFGPASVVLLGGAVFGIAETVRVRQLGNEGIVRFTVLLAAALTALAILCGTAVIVLLPLVGPSLFPDVWSDVRAVMPWLTLLGAAMGISGAVTASLRALDDSAWVLTGRAVTSALSVAIGLPASAAWGATGVLVGLALPECVLAVRAWRRLRHLTGEAQP